MLIPLSSILYEEKFNCRGTIVESQVTQLAELISSAGLINPLTVRTAADAGISTHQYHLVAGHRRFLAVTRLGWTDVEVNLVTPCSDEEAYRLNLIENLGRKNLYPGEEMVAIKRVYGDKPNLATVARDLGVGKEWVRRRLMLDKLAPTVKHHFFDGTLTAFDLSVLIGCPLDQQEALASKLKADKALGMTTTEILQKNGKLNISKTRTDILQMITLLMEKGLKPDGWRCLAWAAGNLKDEELTGSES